MPTLRKKKLWIALSVVLGLLAAFSIYKLAMDSIGVPGKLYQYYPANTGFYLELAPGEKMTRRFVAFLQEQSAQEERMAKSRATLPSAKGVNKQSKAKPTTAASKPEVELAPASTQTKPVASPPDKSKATKAEAPKADSSQPDLSKPATQPEAASGAVKPAEVEAVKEAEVVDPAEEKRRSFRRAFLQKFNSTFDSYFSIGVWPLAAEAKPASPSEKPAPRQTMMDSVTMIVLPLRSDMDLPDVIARFDMKPADFQKAIHQGQPYWVEKHSDTAMAILNRKLLIANSSAGMRSALSHYAGHRPDVFEQPLNRTYLDRLPILRKGTFVLNNQAYLPAAEAKAQDAPLPVSPLSGLAKVLPVTVGSFEPKSANMLSVRTITPLMLEQLPKASRDELQAVYQETASFPQISLIPGDTTFMLAVNRLDKAYDVYYKHLMPPDNQRWVQVINYVLSGLHLDVRKDLVNLFSGRSIIATRAKQKDSLTFVLDKTEPKDKSLNKIATLLSTNAFPIRQETGKVGDSAFNIAVFPMNLPGQSQKRLHYGTVGSYLVLATPNDYLDLLKVRNRKMEQLVNTEVYKAVMAKMPEKNNALLFVNVKEQALAADPKADSPVKWLDSLGLAFWTTPAEPGKVDILDFQVNLRLAEPLR